MKQNNFINLLKVDFKKGIKAISFMVIIGLLCYIVPVLIMEKDEGTTNIDFLITLLIISCYIIPIIQNSYKMNKRKADRVYALPISTKMLAHAKLIMGLLEIIISYTFLYILGFIVVACKQPNFMLHYYVPLYFIILLFAIILYVFNFFISSRANTIFDAILLVALWSFVFLIIVNVINQFIDLAVFYSKKPVDKLGVKAIPFYPIVICGNFYNDWIVSKVDEYNFNRYSYASDNLFREMNPFYFIFYSILGIGSYLGIYFLSAKDRGETVEEVSNGIFGYQPLMAVYLFYFVMYSVKTSQYALIAVGIAMYLVLDVIHKRKFKISKCSLITMGITILVGVILGVILHKTIYPIEVEAFIRESWSSYRHIETWRNYM